ncbi:hypothetical protein CPB86DRAFT_781472 [Serendipita vermifera]|nr:hypothetical protein CPB86DRAFT_781472 [Serendipita vermifera]
MARRNLRPLVVLFAGLGCIWALVWAASAFREIDDDKKNTPEYAIFDIVMGALYAGIMVIEAYGIYAALSQKIPLVRIYAWLSVISALVAVAIEILRLVLHFVFKGQLLNGCKKDLQGASETITSGSVFDPQRTTRLLTDSDIQRICNNAWNKGVFQAVAWMLVAMIMGTIFSMTSFAYYRQLVNPSLLRQQAPTSAYQMNATRNAYGYNNNGNIPGYNPYTTQSYGAYAPPYDNVKLPGYTAGAGGSDDGHPRDEKEGYGYSRPLVQESTDNLNAPYNPFSDRHEARPGDQGYLPPAGPPPGLERDKDEGFDPAAIEAAMKASQAETKGPGNTGGAGPSTSAR